ncbi:tRNA-guanine transglycosylase DpdA [Paenarthrobacter sp. NEAU-H11]|uniref:tRNA-guanine transglycosylase DpdA n=1 Tax=Paenarthrobacter sp. NEAU-H11 TaxID=3423924 RepID=UPI003D337DDE
MKFYFPDSQDLVSPTYDFHHDEYSPLRVRQRDDLYAHEILDTPPYSGLLVSKSIVDGAMKGAGKYTSAQRARLYRLGVERFFRLPKGVESLGDNGAFNYVDELVPPVTVEETLDFYIGCGFDAGVSVDHIIFGYDPLASLDDVDPAWAERRRITLRLAEEFITRVSEQNLNLQPVGAAQGWSPASFADSVEQLQKMGYQRIALGGMVPLKTKDILDCLQEIDNVRLPGTELHLLGVTRVESMDLFSDFGVTSFDSTSAFRQAFMDDRNNFHTENDAFIALRVPQVDGNPALKRAILAGRVSQKDAIAQERVCLRVLREFDGSAGAIERAIAELDAYETICQVNRSHQAEYERTLTAAPWNACECSLCKTLGIEIAIFRGTERNKRRGFHNMSVLANKMKKLKSNVLTSTTRSNHG